MYSCVVVWSAMVSCRGYGVASEDVAGQLVFCFFPLVAPSCDRASIWWFISGVRPLNMLEDMGE